MGWQRWIELARRPSRYSLARGISPAVGRAALSIRGPRSTAKLLDTIAGTVFTAGDNAYPNGAVEDFQSCYAPTWGRHRARTRPSPGNHEYNQTDAAPYYAYFGTNAGPAGRGYYSYELGTWHIISLNSNIPADTASEQARWLRARPSRPLRRLHAGLLAPPCL